ncbi:hypothetical protein [Actinoplanes subtropicus]|uniref:hypothetical protein n=1 Tax=Actinoplanes subtropicus TaxID=543632 RepID=UPI0012FCC681|nr:hypothetical protein [Actinoplanes subtropicus]
MVAAEVLRLVRRRGLMAWMVVLTVGVVCCYYGLFAVQHAIDARHHQPAGGTRSMYHLVDNFGLVVSLLAILIGATVATADVSSGVFRDLVATGRSRLVLFAVRVPGALIVLLPAVVTAGVLAGVGARVFAGGLPAPSVGLIAHYTGWLVAGAVVDLALATGFAALTGSRSITIGVLLGYEAVVTPLLHNMTVLGSVRQWASGAAVARLEPFSGAPYPVAMSVGTAVAVLVAWTVLSLALGAWRTATRDA